jgi:excisionase family DNA binding protein
MDAPAPAADRSSTAAAAATLEPLLGIDELAAYLGVPKQTIYDWRVNAKGPRAHRIGKHLRFAVADVREWVAQQRDPADPAAGG